MKLRIHNNSIRLRLSIPEVEEIAKGNAVRETLDFNEDGSNRLVYNLVPMRDISGISVEFTANKLTVGVPTSMADEWATTERVGLKNDPGHKVAVLIEKDFQCLQKRPDEDESKYFPNPLDTQ